MRLKTKIYSREPRYKYDEIAAACGVSKQAVGAWLRKGVIKDAHLNKLALFFNVTPEWLKYGIDAPIHPNNTAKHNRCEYLESKVIFLENYINNVLGHTV